MAWFRHAVHTYSGATFIAKTDDDSLNNFGNLLDILNAPSITGRSGASAGQEQLRPIREAEAAQRLREGSEKVCRGTADGVGARLRPRSARAARRRGRGERRRRPS